MTRLLFRTFALFALLPYAGVVLLLATGRASWSSIGYVIAIGMLLAGLLTLPDPERKKRRRPRGISRGAVVAIACVALVRALFAGHTTGRMQMLDGGDGHPSLRFVNRLVDEGDVAVAGTRVLVAGGMIADDRRELPGAMTEAYGAMRDEHGDVAAPFAATYLGLERPGAFDLLVIDPPTNDRSVPTDAVIFLHGYAGAFDLPCWQIARAVDQVTACPATRWVGDWGSAAGEATLRRTVDILRGRGIERIVLVGLSNGGYGASMLAPKMKGMFAGLVLVSGAERDAPAAGIPTLVVHGRHDTMADYDDSAAYAKRTGAKLVTLEAGHFAMLVRGKESDEALRHFVHERVRATASR